MAVHYRFVHKAVLKAYMKYENLLEKEVLVDMRYI